MSRKIIIALFLFLTSPVLYAAPLANMWISIQDNEDGTFTYSIKLRNLGPVLPMVTTPKDHVVVDWNSVPPSQYDAGGKFLDDDENIVLFGVDTGYDDIEITSIKNGKSQFHGTAENGFKDSDGNGIRNKVVAWHLPFFGWSLDDTLSPGESIRGLEFTANKRLKEVVYWVGGSDDANIWDDTHIMAEDNFGIYDATLGKYLAVFIERTSKIRRRD